MHELVMKVMWRFPIVRTRKLTNFYITYVTSDKSFLSLVYILDTIKLVNTVYYYYYLICDRIFFNSSALKNI
ncbi:hypothetical protein C1645_771825 [Glomus cerebriforme]|uniref:Uncharacterized protein n=1 Tax=Glomus cerebriforme TaxID=658196 RepID=A0A397SV47_9GLOM|nr:hypothetical protein C1645_771825 [Glomus cerebriforme]